MEAPPNSMENIGLLLTLNNGLGIYHAADTDFIPEINEIINVQLALIPVGRDNLIMNEAAMIVNQMKPEKVVPVHDELKDKEILEKFKSLVDKTI